MSGLEIERKFLVHKNMDWKKHASSCSHIQQGYFAAVNTVRVRIRDDKGYLTIKGPSRTGGNRSGEWLDFFADAIGSTIAVLIGILLVRYRAKA